METPMDLQIMTLRGQRVILDADLARLYGLETKYLNLAIKRNAERFPPDFAFQLSNEETANLRFQIGTSSLGNSSEIAILKLQIATSSLDSGQNDGVSGSWGGRRKLPWAFTEHGVLMAANVLRSPQAIEMSIYLVRAFVRLREQMSANQAILKRLLEIDKQLMQHDGSLRDLYRKLMPLLQPETEKAPPKGRLGFQKPPD